MKNQNSTYGAQVYTPDIENNEDHTQEVIIIIGLVALLIVLICLFIKSGGGKGVIGVSEVMSQLEG